MFQWVNLWVRTRDAATLSATWSGISVAFPTTNGSNEDRTISWSVGGARTVTAAYAGGGTLQYRINSGSYTTYTAGFSLSSGQTLGWRIIFSSSESSTVSVSVDGAALGSFSADASGFP